MSGAEQVGRLGAWVASLRLDDVPAGVVDRLFLTLEDTIGVALAGALTSELVALRRSWPPPDGPCRVLGAGRDAPAEQAVWHNGTATACLELDEGNKFARGHPAAHAFPAALAVAQEADAHGADLCAALLAGHEVAARMGAATMLRSDVHPHGNWGAAGAAAATARLLGLDDAQTAAAIDAACGLAVAGPFEAALRGSFVRNTWTGTAGVHGMQAARLAQAGLADVDGLPDAGLSLLGAFDPGALTDGLGERWAIQHGYFKRHASCSFSHPPADAVLELRERDPVAVRSARQVVVETHALAARLDRPDPRSRLAAMFSIPYVTATALLEGDCAPVRFGDEARAGADVRDLARRVRVERSSDMDSRLPAERPARVTVTTADGATLTAEAANPVGDADHLPFGPPEVARKLEALLPPDVIEPGRLRALLSGLPSAGPVAAVLGELP